MLRVALPHKGELAGPASEIVADAGYRGRSHPRELSVVDDDNDVEFFHLRPRDIATYVGQGRLDLGITGLDSVEESGSPADTVLALDVCRSVVRFAAPLTSAWGLDDLPDTRIATSRPRLLRGYLARTRRHAEVVALDGAAEIAVQLGVADVVADVLPADRTLAGLGLRPVGEPIARSEAVLIERSPRADRADDGATAEGKRAFVERVRGVVLARRYALLELNCRAGLVPEVARIAPGLQAPTVSPLSGGEWVAVRSMVARDAANRIMDELAAAGATAIVVSGIRSCRAVGG